MPQEPTISDLFEMMVVIRGNAVTREDFKAFATKDDIAQLREEMQEGFRSLRSEIRSLEERVFAVEARLERIEKRTIEDDEMIIAEVGRPKQRVTILEQQLLQKRQAQTV